MYARSSTARGPEADRCTCRLARSGGRFHVYYSSRDPLQALHAERLGGLGRVTLHPFDHEEEDLAAELRASGWLGTFLAGLPAGGGSG